MEVKKMPNFAEVTGPLVDKTKGMVPQIVDLLKQKRILPILSNRISNDLLFESHDDLVGGWAKVLKYPFADGSNFVQTSQYTSVMLQAEHKNDRAEIKRLYLEDYLTPAARSLADPALAEELRSDTRRSQYSVSELAERLELLDLGGGTENMLLMLASLPIPIFLTTSYHSILEPALRMANKTPTSEYCRWDPHMPDSPSGHTPSIKEPLVYYLHGQDKMIHSLVMTEDDHLDFLVHVSEDKENLPDSVWGALATSSLLLLGFRLRDWDFRTIFRGLIRNAPDGLRQLNVTIQLEEDQHEQDYLKNYLSLGGANFQVYDGDMKSLVKEIWTEWSTSEEGE